MKATLSFTLPEEQAEFKQAIQGQDMALAIYDIGQEVFRPARKHGYNHVGIQRLIEIIDHLVEEHAPKVPDWPTESFGGEVYYKGATALIGMLEQEFCDIKNRYGIEET